MNRMSITTGLLFTLFLINPPVTRGQGDFSLTWTPISGPEDNMTQMGRGYVSGLGKVPIGLKGTPKNLKHIANYLSCKIAGKSIFLALEGDGRELGNAYVDTNLNGDLSDEKPIPPTRPTTQATQTGRPFFGGMIPYGPFEIKMPTGTVRCLLAMQPGGFGCMLPAGYYAGSVTIGKETYPVAVVDGNFSGNYDDVLALPIKDVDDMNFDSLAIDRDRNGRFDLVWFSKMEVGPLTRLVQIGDGYYSVTVKSDGTGIRVAKANPKMGRLDAGKKDVGLAGLSDFGFFQLANSDQGWSVPEGRYMLFLVQLKEKDDQGKRVALLGRGAPETKAWDIVVRGSRTTTLALGFPLTIHVDVEQTNREVSIGCDIKDAMGMTYQVGTLVRQEKAEPPGIRILDEKDKVLDTGQFSFG